MVQRIFAQSALCHKNTRSLIKTKKNEKSYSILFYHNYNVTRMRT